MLKSRKTEEPRRHYLGNDKDTVNVLMVTGQGEKLVVHGGFTYRKGISLNTGSSSKFGEKSHMDTSVDPPQFKALDDYCIIHRGLSRTVVNGICLKCQRSGRFVPRSGSKKAAFKKQVETI